ncbi:XRE family transcriptional regulator (plasmid) [Photobacterium damselae subsp. piscicida]|uniref:XRE family transcriptional regulator n=2 Tax=Photobacterium damselae TaxID=38293 RepID=A0A5F0YHW6_PHODP|nr:XRE family transcriptional regulator [Photobacterium damselae subsp. piscicida]PSV50198.1 transcriptional regulator [Photobacterium damselae]QOD55289.1 XRE family transcriptional regulator [Photobacterium damselae subsp. piscicida]QOD59114.1 XRE family transcriptional regulator [Photobacterium damselae subsp. piscicida]
MDSVAIKKLIASKGWTLKEIAQRWNRSEGWMSKVINDSERPRYWDDAFNGLISKKNE